MPYCNLTEKVFQGKLLALFTFYICHKSTFGRCNFCGRCVCLPCCKNQRHQTLNAIGTHCNCRHVNGDFVAVSAFQVVAKKQHDFEQLCRNLQRQAKYYQNFSTKKQPEKVAFVFVYKSLYCTNSTPASLMRCAANSSG